MSNMPAARCSIRCRMLTAKFLANALPVIGAAKAGQVVKLVFGLTMLDDVRQLIELCA